MSKSLERVRKKNDLRVADDDHPKRKDISKKEFIEGMKRIFEENIAKQSTHKKESNFAEATIQALNSTD